MVYEAWVTLIAIDKIKQPLLLSFLQFPDFKNHVLFLKGGGIWGT